MDEIRCESCDEEVKAGQKYMNCGELDLCENCAPKVGDILLRPNAFTDEDGNELTFDGAQEWYDELIASGKTVDDSLADQVVS